MKEKNTLGTVLSWIFGGIALFSGILALTAGNIVSSVLYIFTSLLILPLSVNFYENKFNIKLEQGIKVFIFILLWITASVIYTIESEFKLALLLA